MIPSGCWAIRCMQHQQATQQLPSLTLVQMAGESPVMSNYHLLLVTRQQFPSHQAHTICVSLELYLRLHVGDCFAPTLYL